MFKFAILPFLIVFFYGCPPDSPPPQGKPPSNQDEIDDADTGPLESSSTCQVKDSASFNYIFHQECERIPDHPEIGLKYTVIDEPNGLSDETIDDNFFVVIDRENGKFQSTRNDWQCFFTTPDCSDLCYAGSFSSPFPPQHSSTFFDGTKFLRILDGTVPLPVEAATHSTYVNGECRETDQQPSKIYLAEKVLNVIHWPLVPPLIFSMTDAPNE